jgi:hypothetical protein
MAETAENSDQTAETPAAPGRPFQPGVSGNPGGRPKGLAKAVRDIPVEMGSGDGAMLLAKIAWAIVSDPKEKTNERLTAWKLLAERGWGKPAEFVPIEETDPLELSQREATEVALDFGRAVDELAARRSRKPLAASP